MQTQSWIPVFSHCCYCINLKTGAAIIGILTCLNAIFSVIYLLILIFVPSLGLLAFTLYLGLYIPAAIAFNRLVSHPIKENAQRFSDWFIFSTLAGHACLFVGLVIVNVGLAFIVTIVVGCFSTFLWLNVRSYAHRFEFANATYGARFVKVRRQVIVKQPQPDLMVQQPLMIRPPILIQQLPYSTLEQPEMGLPPEPPKGDV